MYKKYKLENIYRIHYFSDPWRDDRLILKWKLKKKGVTGCEIWT
jgi:hypothetical protein